MACTGRLLLAAVLLLSLLSAAASASVAAVEPGQPTEIRLRVATPAYTLDAGGLRVAGYAVNDVPGAPALPVWTTVVELPPTGAWTLSYEAPGEQTFSVAGLLPAAPVPQVDLDQPLSPAEIADRVTRAPLADRPDPAIYAVAAFYPTQPVQAGPEGWLRGRRLLPVRVFPFQYNPVTGEVRYHPDLRVTIAVANTDDARTLQATPSYDQSNQANLRPAQPQDGLRVYTGQRGMYRLTYEDLAGAGVPVDTVNPRTLAMTYLDEPVAIEVVGEEDGRFDPGDLVIFYAEPYQGRYMTRNVYRLTYGGTAAGERMQRRSVTPTGAEPVVTTITQTLRIEFDRSYYSTYNLPKDADHWFDNPLYANSAVPTATVSYPLALDDPVFAGAAEVQAALHGGADQPADPDQSVAIRVNNYHAGTFAWEGSVPHRASAVIPAAWLDAPGSQVTLEAALTQLPGLDFYWVSPDWVTVRYPARPDAEDDQIVIEGFAVTGQAAQLDVTGFSSPSVRAFDVRDPRRPVQLDQPFVELIGSSFTARLWDAWSEDDPPPGYALSADAGLLAPLAIERAARSSWRAPDHHADYIAIVHRSLWDAIQPLLDHRAAEGLRVAKVDVQDIYDEFSGGRVDPEAIRDFLAYAYHRWNGGKEPPRYVLLVGDGHYDFKGAQRPDLPNLIPPYLQHIDPWIGETAADNRFVSVDGPDDYLPDIAVGRIPAKTPADVKAAVDKIIAYETAAPEGAWRARAVFVADDKDDKVGNFHSLSEASRLGLPAIFEGRTIYYRGDAATDTAGEMKQAIRGAFDAGALYLQWFGHASRQRWGGGLLNMFDLLDLPRLSANTALPFTAHYSCWSGYFINVQGSRTYGNSEVTLGEALLLTPGRGAVADFSPSGLHIGSALVVLNQGLVRAIFEARIDRLGLAVDAAKQDVFAHSASTVDLIDTQILFGDPATRLRLPPRRTHLPLIVASQR